jgi:transaldolase
MVKIYLDSASISEMHKWHDKVDGYTSNPTLMRKAGVTDYKSFAMDAIALEKPISLEVIGDDANSIIDQARLLSSWGENVYVKVPIVFTNGAPTYATIQALMRQNVKVNITAVMTDEQMRAIAQLTRRNWPTIVSVFAGRIADTGRDPVISINQACVTFVHLPEVKVLWASAREVYNVTQASQTKCDIITLSPDLIAKLDFTGKDLTEFSVETSRMFYNDAQIAGYQL